MEIKQKKRDEIPGQYKWHIYNLCQTDDDWKSRMEALTQAIDRVAAFAGGLNDGHRLLACLDQCFDANAELNRLYAYATMKMHEDTTVDKYQGMADRAQSMAIKFGAASSFIEPEILSLGEACVRGFINDIDGLKLYEHHLNDLLRQKEHVLSAEIEAILANAGEIGNAPSNVYDMLHDADMKFGTVTDENGDTREVTHGSFIRLLESKSRTVRQDTFNVFYDSYWKQKNTLAALYNASVKKDCFFASTRKYASALDASLSTHNIPRTVYQSLIDTVHAFLPDLHRYVRLRKKALQLDELHMYDLYTPIVPSQDPDMPYEKAQELMLKSLTPLGAEYEGLCRDALQNGWIDVYENEGKCSGAYSWGAQGCHPFILMNYDNKLDDLFTLAHEMGHAIHSHYSWTTQPPAYSDYTIFLAEVASTVNEALLMEHMLAQSNEASVRAYLLNHYLEQFRGTVFRQTLFAEFEMTTHDMAQKGEPLTVDTLNALYRGLNQKYYGPDIVLDDKIDLEWGRIPHFYNAFYVYQYATGFSAAIALSQQLLKSGGAKDAYLGFLKSGSADYSISILKKAGVDMSTPQPVREALQVFGKLLTELEGLL